jgi:hypothetical protein
MKSNCGIFRAWTVEKVKLESGERQTGKMSMATPGTPRSGSLDLTDRHSL